MISQGLLNPGTSLVCRNPEHRGLMTVKDMQILSQPFNVMVMLFNNSHSSRFSFCLWVLYHIYFLIKTIYSISRPYYNCIALIMFSTLLKPNPCTKLLHTLFCCWFQVLLSHWTFGPSQCRQTLTNLFIHHKTYKPRSFSLWSRCRTKRASAF